jgi:ribosomal protein L22
MTKEHKLLRTERSSIYRSTILPTSVKKLTKIMHQIAGKTVSEALVQLRFSKKKVARDVYKGLIIAQDEAIAGRGMGLGSKAAISRWTEQRNEIVTPSVADPHETVPKTTSVNQIIELKDGSKRKVTDPTEIYIDQAWVGKGVEWNSPEFRARGRVNMLTHRTTSTSCLASALPHHCPLLTHCQPSPCSSRRRRRACASPTRSRRSATTASCGPPCPTDPSLHSASTACGSRRHHCCCRGSESGSANERGRDCSITCITSGLSRQAGLYNIYTKFKPAYICITLSPFILLRPGIRHGEKLHSTRMYASHVLHPRCPFSRTFLSFFIYFPQAKFPPCLCQNADAMQSRHTNHSLAQPQT